MTVTSAACKASAARGLGRWRSWSMARARACVRARARAALALGRRLAHARRKPLQPIPFPEPLCARTPIGIET